MTQPGTVTSKMVSKARDILDGKTDSLEDWRDAFELLQAAAQLQSGEAHCVIASMYESKRYMKTNLEKALFHYKQAIKLNYSNAAAGMAVLYGVLGEPDNCLKTWKFYFFNASDNDAEIGVNIYLHVLDAWHFGFDINVSPVVIRNGTKAIPWFLKNTQPIEDRFKEIHQILDEISSLDKLDVTRRTELLSITPSSEQIEKLRRDYGMWQSVYNHFSNTMLAEMDVSS